MELVAVQAVVVQQMALDNVGFDAFVLHI